MAGGKEDHADEVTSVVFGMAGAAVQAGRVAWSSVEELAVEVATIVTRRSP